MRFMEFYALDRRQIGVTVLMFLIVYGGYFIATYLSCKHMVMEKQIEELEV